MITENDIKEGKIFVAKGTALNTYKILKVKKNTVMLQAINVAKEGIVKGFCEVNKKFLPEQIRKFL